MSQPIILLLRAEGGGTFPVPVPVPVPPPPTGKPSALNTGYAPTGVTLTPYPATGGPGGPVVSGVLTLATAGLALSGFLFSCRIVIKAANISLRKFKVAGPASAPGAATALVDCTDAAARNCLLEDGTLDPAVPSAFWTGVRGHDFTAQRCNLARVTDGFAVYNTHNTGGPVNVSLLANFVHELAGFGPPFTKNNCVRWSGGSSLLARGNNFAAFLDMAIGQAGDVGVDPNAKQNPSPANSALSVTQSTGLARGLTWDHNWQDGGSATLTMSPTGGATGLLGALTGNKFGRASYQQPTGTNGVPGSGHDQGTTVLSSGFNYSSTAGNVYEDNGHPVTLRITPPPPPPVGTTLMGDTPRGGSDAAGVRAVDALYGAGGTIRLFCPSVATPSPVSDRPVVGSFKRISASTPAWARQMWRWAFIHEIDSKDAHPEKFPSTTANVAQWRDQMATLVAMGIPGLSVIVTADCFVNGSKDPSDYLISGVTHWGVDFDGISSSTGYHNYSSVLAAVTPFMSAHGLSWGVGELSADRATSTDPSGSGRAAWLNLWAGNCAAAGAEYVCVWENNFQPGSLLTSAAEQAAMRALMAS
jgi:hypothetical protein